MAEFELGAAQAYEHVLGVFWGTGVGGGMILNRERWRGRASAGEIGHVVVKMGGARAPAGAAAVWRPTRAAAPWRPARARRSTRAEDRAVQDHAQARARPADERCLLAALEEGDQLAIQLIDRAIAALGAGIASTVNLLDVEAVIIGGGLGIRLGQPFADRIAEAMPPHLFTDDRPPDVRVAALGDLGGAIGARCSPADRARPGPAQAAAGCSKASPRPGSG